MTKERTFEVTVRTDDDEYPEEWLRQELIEAENHPSSAINSFTMKELRPDN